MIDGEVSLTPPAAPGPRRSGWAVVAIATLCTSCTGLIDGADARQPGATSGGTPVDTVSPPGTSSGPVPTPGPNPMATASGDAPPDLPGPVFLRRLTNTEYNNSVRDLLGETGDAADRARQFGLVPDGRVRNFDNDSTNIAMSAAVFEAYVDAAEAVARETMSIDAVRTRLLGCDPGAAVLDEACLRSAIAALGRRAFRRPLLAEEAAALLTLARQGRTPREGGALVLQHLLLSPSFLYRVELGEPSSDRPGLVKLTGFEVATRLSYLLHATTPAESLLARAATGELATAEGVEKAARDLLADPRARTALQRFAQQWLQVDTLANIQPEPAKVPAFTAELRASMSTETNLLLGDLMWRRGASFLDLYDAAYTFVDRRLASFYGLGAPGGDWARTALPASSHRGGIVTHASVLTVTSKLDHTSPILRGKYVREVLMCHAVPNPPADIPALPDVSAVPSGRARFERHSQDPACSSCHALMDPIGFALDEFDAIGARRSVDEKGKPIDTRGTLSGAEGNPAFEGGVELGRRLREIPSVRACVATQAFRWVFGRTETPADEGTLRQVRRAFEAGQFGFQELLLAFVRSNAFRYRLPSSSQGGWN